MTEALKGKALLDAITSLGKVSKTEAVRATGYVSFKKDGTERLNFTAFYAAVLEAKGMTFIGGDDESSAGGKGKGLSFLTTVHQNGAIHLGPSYAEMMGAATGDKVRIKTARGRITLTLEDPTDTPAVASGAAGEADEPESGFEDEIDEVDDGVTAGTFRELATAA